MAYVTLRFGALQAIARAAAAVLCAGLLTACSTNGPDSQTGSLNAEPKAGQDRQMVKVALLVPLSAQGQPGVIGKSLKQAAELALFARDSAQLGRYAAILRQSGAQVQSAAFEAAGRVVRDGRLDSATVAAAVRSSGAFRGALTGVTRAPAMTADSLIGFLSGALRAVGATGPNQKPEMILASAMVMLGLGRFDQAQPAIDSLQRIAPQVARDAILLPVLFGFAPEGHGAREIAAEMALRRSDPIVARRQAMLAISVGDLGLAGRVIDSMLAVDSVKIGPRARALFTADRGRLLIARGDTANGIAALRSGIRAIGASGAFLTMVNRLVLAQVLAARPETRAEGVRLLEWGFVSEFGMVGIVELSLARAAELAGDKPVAVRHYSRFLRLWDRPSPGAEGPANEARAALQRLTGEGQPLR